MMDGLARIEPVARSLLREVDAVLTMFGAPSTHPIWPLLRRLKSTPVDAVTFFVEIDPARLRAAGAELREQASRCLAMAVPADVSWQGAAGAAFTAQVTALAGHLAGDGSRTGDGSRAGDGVQAGDGAPSLVGRLVATASYVEDLAGWYERSRAHLARVLAEALTSAQAVTLRTSSGLADGLGPPNELAAPAEGHAGAAPRLVVIAAAEIGAAVLDTVARALDEGPEVPSRWAHRLDELPFRGPAGASPAQDPHNSSTLVVW